MPTREAVERAGGTWPPASRELDAGRSAGMDGDFPVETDVLIDRLFESLVNGDRAWARSLVEEAGAKNGMAPDEVTTEVLWPAYEMVSRLYRADQLSTLGHHMATRLLRTLCDQVAMGYERRASLGRSVFAVCGPTDADELAAQIAIDLLERDGFDVAFAGGGIANDEILARVQETQPDVLLLFASAPSDLPNIRELIDTIQEIGACGGTQVVVGGGVFNRAEGLAEEIGADLWATEPAELCQVMLEEPQRRAVPEQRTVGRKRKAA
jgi:methanogenic corrinoid protein MtbC1